MFDTFVILVPELTDWSELSIRQRQTAFGPVDEAIAHVREVPIGSVVGLAQDTFTANAIQAWAGGLGRELWTVLSLQSAANSAAAIDHTWSAFLGAVRDLLEHHPTWRVQCESDCDQHSLTRMSLTPTQLAELLDSYRATNFYPIAFLAETSSS